MRNYELLRMVNYWRKRTISSDGKGKKESSLEKSSEKKFSKKIFM